MRVPLHEILEALLVLKNGAQAAQTDPLQCIVAILDQIQQDLDTLNVKEVQLAAFVSIDRILEAVESGEDEGSCIARLVHFAILHVVLQNLDSTLPSEHLLVVSTVLANVRENIE